MRRGEVRLIDLAPAVGPVIGRVLPGLITQLDEALRLHLGL